MSSGYSAHTTLRLRIFATRTLKYLQRVHYSPFHAKVTPCPCREGEHALGQEASRWMAWVRRWGSCVKPPRTHLASLMRACTLALVCLAPSVLEPKVDEGVVCT